MLASAPVERRSPPPGDGRRDEIERPGERIAEDDREVEIERPRAPGRRARGEPIDVLAEEERGDVGPAVALIERRVPGHDDREHDHAAGRDHHRRRRVELPMHEEIDGEHQARNAAATGPLVSTPRPTDTYISSEEQPAPLRVALGRGEEQQRQRHEQRDVDVDEDAAREHQRAAAPPPGRAPPTARLRCVRAARTAKSGHGEPAEEDAAATISTMAPSGDRQRCTPTETPNSL